MTKTELIKIIADKFQLSGNKVGKIINFSLELIKSKVADEPVQLGGFGTFEMKDGAARTGRNPKTGEVIDIPAKKRIRFKAGKAFKEAINADSEE